MSRIKLRERNNALRVVQVESFSCVCVMFATTVSSLPRWLVMSLTPNSYWNSHLDAEVCSLLVSPAYGREPIKFFEKEKVGKAKTKVQDESKQSFPPSSSLGFNAPKTFTIQVYIRDYSRIHVTSFLTYLESEEKYY